MPAHLVSTLRSAGVELALAEVRLPVVDAARRDGLPAEVGEDRVFPTLDEAVQALGSPP